MPRPHPDSAVAGTVVPLPLPPLRGGVALTQSRYGERGNFELLAPDAVDGLWVFWHNNDPLPTGGPRGDEPAPGPPPGEWSGGLRFAHGRRFDDAQIVQSSHGPDHLEVLARSGPDVHRFRWSPRLGFTDQGVLPVPPAGGAVALTETAQGVLHTAVPLAAGGVAHLVADAARYPQLSWRRLPLAASGARVASAVLVADPLADDGVRLLARVDGLVRLLPGATVGPGRPGEPSGGAVLAHGGLIGPDHALRVFTVAEFPAHDGAALLAETGSPGLAAGVAPGGASAQREARLLVHDAAGRLLGGALLPGSGPVVSLAVTGASFDPDRTEAVVHRGAGLIQLTRAVPDGPWTARTVRSRVRTPPFAPAPAHRD